MATHSSIPAQRIPWTEESGGPQSIGSHRIDMTEATSHGSIHPLKKMRERERSFLSP